MAENKKINITVETSSATKNVEKLNNELKKTSEAAKKNGADLTEVSKITGGFAGGAISKFQGLSSTLGGVSKAFNTMKGAIIATGIGALVVIIGSLITAFKSSAEGQDKFAKIMGAIGAVTGKLIDTLAAFGEIVISVFENPKKAINDFAKLIKENIVNRFNGLLELIPALGKAVTQLFSGDFAGAAKTAADASAKVALGVENITDKINNAKNATKEYIKELQNQAKIGAEIAADRNKADALERDLIVKRSEADRRIADLREKAVKKDTFSLKERIAFLTEASAIENKISAQEIQAAILKRDAKILENKQTRSNKEALIEEEQLKAKVIQLDTARLQAQKTLGKGIQTLRAEANADLKAKTDEENKITENAKKALSDLENKYATDLQNINAKTEQQKLDLQKQRDLKELESVAKSEEEKVRLKISLNEKYAILQSDLDKKLADEKLKKDQEVYNKEDAEFLRLQELTTTKQEYETLVLTQKYEKEYLAAAGNAELQKALQDQLAIDIKAIDEKALNDKRILKEQELALTAQTFGKISELAGKNSKIGKAFAVGQALINTYQGITAELQTKAVTPYEIGLKVANVAFVAATGFKAVKQILATNTSLSGGGSAPSVGGVGGGAAPQFNVVGQGGANQIAESMANRESQPIKAYVVGQDVTTSQSLNRSIVNNATLG
jgi:hypothetical protein